MAPKTVAAAKAPAVAGPKKVIVAKGKAKALTKSAGKPVKGILKHPTVTAAGGKAAAAGKAAAGGKAAAAGGEGGSADLSFLKNHGERKAAYGRLKTAVYASGRSEAIDLYEQLSRPGQAGRFGKMQTMLADWVIDPSFGKACARYDIFLEGIEEDADEEEKLTLYKLQQKEGKEGAQHLIDNGLVEACTDNYGRDAWRYVSQKGRRTAKKTQRFNYSIQSDLDAPQATAVQTALLNSTTSLSSRGRTPTNKAPMTPEEKKRKSSS